MSIPAQDKYNNWISTIVPQLNANYGGCSWLFVPWSNYMNPFISALTTFYNVSVGSISAPTGRVVSLITNMSTAYMEKCGGKQLIGVETSNTFQEKINLLNKFVNGNIFDLAYSELLPSAPYTIEYIVNNVVSCNNARDTVISATNWVNSKTTLITSTIDNVLGSFDTVINRANKAMGVIGAALNCGEAMYNAIEPLIPIGMEIDTDWANTVQAVKDAKAIHTNYMDIFNAAKAQTNISLGLEIVTTTVKNDIQYWILHFEDI